MCIYIYFLYIYIYMYIHICSIYISYIYIYICSGVGFEIDMESWTIKMLRQEMEVKRSN